jgi:hypothetical protein
MIRALVPDGLKGWIDYYRVPERRSEWGGPFNGQAGRRQIFEALLTAIRPQLILETGTCLGSTTELFAQTGLPVVTIENYPRNYGFAHARLRRLRNVQLRFGDSRVEIRRVLDQHRIALQTRPLFAYLDAHWEVDLPLAEEIDIIFSRSPYAVVMIDDFEVPNDPGFSYDDFGPGKALNAKYIAPLAKEHDLSILYPSVSSQQETGRRRGCVVLCKAAMLGNKLQALSLLRST